jgi:phytoene synthase
MSEQYDYCEALIREADKDRFLASLFAPAELRPDLFALYAFDLETASVAHRVRDPAAGEIRLQWWHDALDAGEGSTGHPVADAITDLIDRHHIDPGMPLGLIDARRRALYPEAVAAEAEFELFAAQTAGAVFLMAAQVLGGSPDETTRLTAHHAGFAAASSQLSSGDASYDRMAAATRHRAAARDLVARLPGAVLPAFLPLALAVDDRARLPQWRKQWILWRASKNLARWI